MVTKQITSIAKPFHKNVVAIYDGDLFYAPLADMTKAILEDYAGELTKEEYKVLILKLERPRFTHLVFFLRHPYGIKMLRN